LLHEPAGPLKPVLAVVHLDRRPPEAGDGRNKISLMRRQGNLPYTPRNATILQNGFHYFRPCSNHVGPSAHNNRSIAPEMSA
jgi:hypothetical protein